MSEPIFIPDEPRSMDTSNCLYPPEYQGHLERLLISHAEIRDCCRALADRIHEDYQGRRPVLVCVLKGANPFYQYLLDALQEKKQGYYMEFLQVSSYEGTSTTGTVKIGDGLQLHNLKGKDILLVEDIIDTGTTLSHLLPVLQRTAQPKSMEVCSLLAKRLPEPAKCQAKYVGFSIPNHFIIGLGLDYNELYRDLQDIWVISKAGVEFDAASLHAK